MTHGVKTQLYWVTFSSIPTQIICFVISIYTARILLPEDFGILGIAMMLIGYANLISNIGLNEAIIQRNIVAPSVINSIFTIDLLISIILTIIMIESAGFFAGVFNMPKAKLVIEVSAIVFIVTSFQGVSEAILRREMKYKIISFLNMSKALTSSLLTLGLAFLGYGFWSLVIGQLIPLVIITILSVISAKWLPGLSYKHNDMRRVYDFGIWNFAKAQLQFFVEHLDKAIIGRYLGAASLGIYDKSVSIATMPLSSITMNINAVMFSSFSRDKDDIVSLKNTFQKSVMVISIINTPMYIGLIIIAPYFVKVLLGDNWSDMTIPFQIILLACIVKSFGGISSGLNIGVGNYRNNTIRLFVAAIIFFVLCSALVKYGVVGISIAFLCYTLISVASIMQLSLKKINTAWIEIFRVTISGVLPSILLYIVLSVLIKNWFYEKTILNMMLIIGIGIISYIAFFALFATKDSKRLAAHFMRDLKLKKR